jgi:hypothetical protein
VEERWLEAEEAAGKSEAPEWLEAKEEWQPEEPEAPAGLGTFPEEPEPLEAAFPELLVEVEAAELVPELLEAAGLTESVPQQRLV